MAKIEELSKQSDAELHKLLGHASQLKEFREALAEGAKLTGKARTEVEDKLERMLQPHIYPGDLKYTVEHAKRKSRSGDEVLKDSSPCCCLD